uniref:Nucleotide-diphospho-sugar transferase domain-containing protein n=1 Tax=Haptolina ericina TaxID=156174 RepID=A0A7S3EV24_9EUKA
MMKRLAHRMETEATWDQTAYNEEQFYPAHGTHGTVGVTSRVMNYFCNLNSKTFFRFFREDASLLHGYKPLSLHINYHPEKLQRMQDVFAFYFKGVEKGIWRWNGGEGSKLLTECKKLKQAGAPDESKPHIAQILKSGVIDWGTCLKCIKPQRGGLLKTPWEPGRWGEAGEVSAYPDFKDTVFATLGGAMHLLRFNETGEFLSTRCSDGELLKGRLVFS